MDNLFSAKISLDRLGNEARTCGMAHNENYEIVREFNAVMKHIEAGIEYDPEEIWELVQRLFDAGEHGYAHRLGRHLPD